MRSGRGKCGSNGLLPCGICGWRRTERRDKDNIAFAKKFIQDALVKEKVLENDGWAQIDSWTDAFAVDAQRPRVEVELEEV